MKQELSCETGNAVMWISVFTGAISGSILKAVIPDAGMLHTAFFRQGLGLEIRNSEIGELLLHLCGIPLLWMLFAAVLGTSLAGKPLGFGLLFFRGMAVGAVLCELYLLQGAGAFLTAVLFVFPFAAAGTFLFMLAVREMNRFSAALIRCVQGGESPEVRLYLLRFLVLAGFLLLTGGLQCIWLKSGFAVMTGK